MKGNRLRVYINPLIAPNLFGGYVDVSDDVDFSSIGSIDRNLDNTDYNIGIYRTSNISLTFRNDSGYYSDVGQPTSIFLYRRGGSKVKITWQQEQDGFKAGFFKAGNISCGPEIELFEGLLNDDSLTLDLSTREETFSLLGLESVLNGVGVNFAALTIAGQPLTLITIASPGVLTAVAHGLVVGNPIQLATTGTLPSGLVEGTTYFVQEVLTADTFTLASALSGAAINTTGSYSGTVSYQVLSGQLLSDVLKTILNQTAITNVLAFDATQINVGVDNVLDSIADAQNKDVLTVLQDLLLLSNSVFFIQNNTLVVAPRTPSVDVKKTFYGQSSIDGQESIQTLNNIKNGMNQLFNYFYWTPSNNVAKNATSITKYGQVSKSFNQTYVADVAKQTTILNSLLNEFGFPKQSMDLYTPVSYENFGLALLNQITVDFPPMYLPGNSPFPIDGTAICGQAVLPAAVWTFTERVENPYKLLGTSFDPSTWLMKLTLRRI